MSTRSFFSVAARAILAALLLIPTVGYAQFDRSQCFQYGGANVCFAPAIGRWKYTTCAEGGASLGWFATQCAARGGTWDGTNCNGIPPELWRPVVESDIVPISQAEFTVLHQPLCEGPSAPSYSWNQNIFSNSCSTAGPGAIMVQGYEQHNNTGFFQIVGKKLNGATCGPANTTLTYSASRDRLVQCPSHNDNSYVFTTGATPALCALGWVKQLFPWQPCETCSANNPGLGNPNPAVANPIDPISGVKRQVEVDYEWEASTRATSVPGSTTAAGPTASW